MDTASTVMYVNLYGNSTAFQTLAMLQGASYPLSRRASAERGAGRPEARAVHEAAAARDVCGADRGVDYWVDIQLYQCVLLSSVVAL